MRHSQRMRRVTIRRLHEETTRMIDAVRAGEVIIVQRRGVPVAELRAVAVQRPKLRLPDFNRRYAKFPRVKTDSGRILEGDRR
jgi:antitoxin (DNA-binding transcriptional repressor) of toxin-antitoxin stability system